MRYVYKIIWISFSVFFSISDLAGQIKFEKESEVSVDVIPAAAIKHIDALGLTSIVEWYKEESQDGISYEAKFKHQKYKWSAEFSEEGVFQDLEALLQFEFLPAEEKSSIRKGIESNFKDYTITKLQIHWAEAKFLQKSFLEAPDLLRPYLYEVIIRINTESGWAAYELQIDPDGQIVRQLKLSTRPTDNMDF